MNILINEKKQAQCPVCGKWNSLELESINGLIHEFTCCHKNFIVAIDEENLNKLSNGKKIPNKTSNDWWVIKEQ